MPLPLTIIIIADSVENTSGNVAQNYGKNFVQSANHFSLDKLCKVWYNGKLAAARWTAARHYTTTGIRCQDGIFHKKSGCFCPDFVYFAIVSFLRGDA